MIGNTNTGVIIGWIISAGAVTLLQQFIQWRLRCRKVRIQNAAVKDCATDAAVASLRLEMSTRFGGIEIAVREMLLDRILYLGRAYLRDAKVDADDRRRLVNMHDIYHKVLGGNGDADMIMSGVAELPLK